MKKACLHRQDRLPAFFNIVVQGVRFEPYAGGDGIIKLDTARIKDDSGKAKYVRAYVFDPDFVRVLEKMANGFHNLGTGRKPEEE